MQDDRADALLRVMSERLGLAYAGQDWGITNAVGERLNEFIEFFESEPLAPTQRYELADLILASANERLLEGGDVDHERLIRLVSTYPSAFLDHLVYWRGLADKTEFPIGSVLRLLFAE